MKKPSPVGCGVALLLLAASHQGSRLSSDEPASALPPMVLRSISSGGRTRWFRVYAPSHYNSEQALPVVLAFHGGGGSARQFAKQSRLDLTAEAHNFLLVFPEGSGPRGGPPYFQNETWNAGECCGWAQRHAIDDVQFVRDMVIALAKEWVIDPAHIYATGHSNGGMMSYRLGVDASDLCAAIAPNAAACCTDGIPTHPLPILVFHGAMDTHVPSQGGVGVGRSGTHYRSLSQSLSPFIVQNGGRGMHLVETRGAAQKFESLGDFEAPIQIWWLQDGGHSWPGLGANPRTHEATNYDIDSNEELWLFFSQF